MKDPYKVLGLDSSADPELIKSRYDELHALYSEQMFKSGEEGNEGARKLQELEEAWAMISAESTDTVKSESGGNYDAVDALIRDGKYDEAQNILDSIQERNGEWHYMQSIIFYKREWLTDSKTQLEMALRDDPNNAKYRSSLDKLNMVIGGANANNNANNNNGQRTQNANNGQYGNGQYNNNPPPYYDSGDYQQQQDMSNCLSTCCCAYCLTDCLCNAMRCC